MDVRAILRLLTTRSSRVDQLSARFASETSPIGMPLQRFRTVLQHSRSIAGKTIAILLALASPAITQTRISLANEIAALKQLPLEELLNIEVTTVARRPERLVRAPSAIQVITADEIRRSGASSLPEALRLATNLHVFQIDSSRWAISARGFTALTANKLLVLIDGRTVYTPLFAGVFWDVQNVMLEDIDRIEVISGPGATLWGSNAVNGVINVVTKTARDTQGGLLSGGGGSLLRGFGNIRYGDRIGEDVYLRAYGMGFDRGSTVFPDGRRAGTGWFLGQGGFRADWLPPDGRRTTFQGNFYGGEVGRVAPGAENVNGQNLLGRWTQPLGTDSDLTFQLYWDRTWRRIPGSIAEDLNTYDIEFQHRFPWGQRHRFLWGGGYRLMEDRVLNAPGIAFLPARRTLQLFSGFIQDEITLLQNELFFTIGSRFEHNDYSGFEFQPTFRVAWLPLDNHTLWGAVSRAVRAPSRIDTEVFAPATPPFTLRGDGRRFDSEKLIAYELGYRAELIPQLAVSISGFFHDYDDIRSVEPIAGAPGQFIILNRLRARTHGAELSATWRPVDWWGLRGGYTYFQKRIFLDRSQDINRGRAEGNDPQHQFLLQSMLNLPADFELDSVLRFVDNLNQRGPTVPSYFELDLRLAWHPTPQWEIALVGQNLLHKRHPEFGAPATRQEIPRSIYGKLTWRFGTGK